MGKEAQPDSTKSTWAMEKQIEGKKLKESVVWPSGFR
jgi:hypothetical protein